MIRLWLLFGALTGVECWAFQVYRSHPIVLPDYFKMMLLGIQFLMCWGAFDSSRWMLRRSPIARRPGPTSDWLRLWLWMGPSGGTALLAACYLGRWVDSLTTSRLAGPLIVAHVSGGALAWMVAAGWALPELLSDPVATAGNKGMALAGLLFHGLGLYIYLTVYPGSLGAVFGLVAPITYFALLLYYVLIASLLCDLYLRVVRAVD
jgi:hypothetical protein